MKFQKIDNQFIVRFEQTDELVKSLEVFCIKNKVLSGSFWGIGAVAHAVVSDSKMQAFGGHLLEAKVNPTLELYLNKSKIINRFFDKKTGLWLLDL